jgi:Ni/Co efflux regulator RcnB
MSCPADVLAGPASDQAPPPGAPDQPHQQGEGREGHRNTPPGPNVPSAAATGHARGGGPGGRGHSGPAGLPTPQVQAPRVQPSGPTPQEQSHAVRSAAHGAAAVHRQAPTAPFRQVQPVQPQLARPRAPETQFRRQPPAQPPLADWNRSVRGPDRDLAGQQWRQTHRNWDSNAPWRQAPDWWRRDRAFGRYAGPRIGFFFIPDRGYVSVPPQYQRRYWQAGDYLPNWFWAYVVRDYWRYGLPQPPEGCAWVWVDGDVALIDRADGYILDIVHNLW